MVTRCPAWKSHPFQKVTHTVTILIPDSWLVWGSEIRTSLDFEWSKRGWESSRGGLGVEWWSDNRIHSAPVDLILLGETLPAMSMFYVWDLKSRSPTIWNQDKCLPFYSKPVKIRTKTSGFWIIHFLMFGAIGIAKAWPFENLTFKKSWFQMFPDFKWSILDPHCTVNLSEICFPLFWSLRDHFNAGLSWHTDYLKKLTFELRNHIVIRSSNVK